jgi:hypothetical protein
MLTGGCRRRSRTALVAGLLGVCCVPAFGQGARAQSVKDALPCTVVTACPPPPPKPPSPTPQPSPSQPRQPMLARSTTASVSAAGGPSSSSRATREPSARTRSDSPLVGAPTGRASSAATARGSQAGISAAGDASGSHTFRRAFILGRGRRRIHGHEAMSFHLRFSADQLTGSFRDRFRSARVRCSSGWVRFTAYRDGSAQAPLRSAHIDTAHYRGAALSLRVFLPQHLITRLRITWTWYCPGHDHVQRASFELLPIRGTRFHLGGRGHLPVKNGLHFRYHWRCQPASPARPTSAPTADRTTSTPCRSPGPTW